MKKQQTNSALSYSSTCLMALATAAAVMLFLQPDLFAQVWDMAYESVFGAESAVNQMYVGF